MSKERILSFEKSKQLSIEDAQSVSAAGMTSYTTAHGSYQNGDWDATVDVTVDF